MTIILGWDWEHSETIKLEISFVKLKQIWSRLIRHFFWGSKLRRQKTNLMKVAKVPERRDWDAGTQLDRTDPELFDFNSEVKFVVRQWCQTKNCQQIGTQGLFLTVFWKGCRCHWGDCGSQHGKSSQVGFTWHWRTIMIMIMIIIMKVIRIKQTFPSNWRKNQEQPETWVRSALFGGTVAWVALNCIIDVLWSDQ